MPKRLEICAVAGLLFACAAYEQEAPEPSAEEPGGGAAGSVGSAGTGSSNAGSGALPRGGTSAVGAAGGSAGSISAMGGATGGGGSPSAPSSGAAGQAISGADGNGSAGAAGAVGMAQSWTFDQGSEGWEVREQSPELGTMLVPATGAVRVVDVPFSAAKQFVDVAFTFPSDVDLRGRTLRAVVQRVSGEFVGAQLYVYGAAWGSPGFESLTSGKATTLAVSLDALGAMGVTPASIARVGIKLQTGSNSANTFGPTTVEITEVAIE